MALRKSLQEHDIAELGEMWGNVARNQSTDHRQSDTAYALRSEWVRLSLRARYEKDFKADADQESLKNRMAEFLSGVPAWMLSGV